MRISEHFDKIKNHTNKTVDESPTAPAVNTRKKSYNHHDTHCESEGFTCGDQFLPNKNHKEIIIPRRMSIRIPSNQKPQNDNGMISNLNTKILVIPEESFKSQNGSLKVESNRNILKSRNASGKRLKTKDIDTDSEAFLGPSISMKTKKSKFQGSNPKLDKILPDSLIMDNTNKNEFLAKNNNENKTSIITQRFDDLSPNLDQSDNMVVTLNRKSHRSSVLGSSQRSAKNIVRKTKGNNKLNSSKNTSTEDNNMISPNASKKDVTNEEHLSYHKVTTIDSRNQELSNLSFEKIVNKKLGKFKNNFTKKETDVAELSVRIAESKQSLKWNFIFKELRKMLIIFMDQRKRCSKDRIYEEFCDAVHKILF